MKRPASGLRPRANSFSNGVQAINLPSLTKMFERHPASAVYMLWLRRFGRWHALAFEGFSARALPGSFSFRPCRPPYFPHCFG